MYLVFVAAPLESGKSFLVICPPQHSSPIIWGERIFLTSALENGRRRLVICLDRQDGRILWERVAWTGDPEPAHLMNGWASATCATDGKRDLREAQRSSRDAQHRSSRERHYERQGPDPSVEVETEAEAEPSRDLPEFPDVLGWQPLVLNQPQECAGCGRAMGKGDRASLGLSSEGRPSAYLCELCVEAI